MNILFIANHLNTGGISSYLFTLASGLKEKGHNIYLASDSGELSDKFMAAGIQLISIPLKTKKEISPKIILSFLRLRKIVRLKNINLIHSHSRTTQVLGNLLSRAQVIPHIFTCHGFFKPKLSRRLFPCWGEHIIAISQEVNAHLINDFKLDKQKITVIHNGIDIKNFGDFSKRDQLRKNLGISDSLVIGTIGRLSSVKGQIYLIRAMPEVIKVFPQARLLIVGVGKIKDALISETEDLGIRGNVLFIPKTDDTNALLCAMDIFLMPSLQEGLGLALMEAMAQGLAVVGSAVGGIKTLIVDQVNGLLIPPADVQGITAAIIKLAKDSQLRRNLGVNARKLITESFTKRQMVDKTEAVYKDCLARNQKNE